MEFPLVFICLEKKERRCKKKKGKESQHERGGKGGEERQMRWCSKRQGLKPRRQGCNRETGLRIPPSPLGDGVGPRGRTLFRITSVREAFVSHFYYCSRALYILSLIHIDAADECVNV